MEKYNLTPNITYQYGIDAKINIIADPSIEDGGCIFQTNNGIVDASIDTQLEIIKKALEGIEEKIQYDYLIQNNCDYVQGNYIGKPLPIFAL